MANTLIQIKRSTTTNAPASLSVAEQAYSYLSEKLFIGNSSGNGVEEIGGKYWVTTTQTAYDQANTSRIHANAAHLTANAAFDAANASYGQANTARDHANSAHVTANAAFDQANTARVHANAAHLTANAAFDKANAVEAFANTLFSANGGTITGNVSIVGDLVISGNTYQISASELRIGDSLIYLAGNNYSSDIVDIGLIANYVNATGSNVHTGLYREHEDKMWYLFQGYDAEPANNHIGALSNNMSLAVLNADLKTSNLVLGGVNAITWISSSYVQANTARDHANAAHLTANAGYDQANTARVHANAAHLTANAGYDQANTARIHANAAHLTANASYDAANAAYGQANTARNHANSAFAAANTANTNAANASFMTTGVVNDTLISGAYPNITGLGTIVTGTWNANIIKVPYGGTGANSFTTNGILYGNNAGDLKVTSAGTEGQVLQASATGVPQFGMLDGGTF